VVDGAAADAPRRPTDHRPAASHRPARTKDTTLTVAAMIPAGLFWTMVMAGSFHGLVAFGRDMVGWRDGWEYLVPGTLDGVSVTFAFLAFQAVRKKKAPDRCRRVVWGRRAGIRHRQLRLRVHRQRPQPDRRRLPGAAVAVRDGDVPRVPRPVRRRHRRDPAQNPAFGLRWITWPTNTFCAAVAWQNHPPADDTPATRRNALANLDRVRALKRQARQASIAERHRQTIAAARREAELAASQAGRREPVQSATLSSPASNGRRNEPEPRPVASVVPPAATLAPGTARPTQPPARLAVRPDPSTIAPPETNATDVRAPATATTLMQWARTWIKMCGDGDTAVGPLNDDARARAVYALSAKQLRNIRNAATSGALRRRAAELGVELPAEYGDQPVKSGINGYTIGAPAA